MNVKEQRAKLTQKLKACEKHCYGIRKELEVVQEIESGDRPSPDQKKRIKSQRFSYQVRFTRRKVLNRVRSPGAVNVSLRRFSSPKEANQHGKRFTRIWKHKGFVVVKVNKRANAWINWTTGKTNPVIGL